VILANIVSPLASELGVGGISGLCVGYSIKKFAKIVTVILSFCFLGLQYLAYNGFIEIKYRTLEGLAMGIVGETSAFQEFLIFFLAQMPYDVGFLGGLAIGLKKG